MEIEHSDILVWLLLLICDILEVLMGTIKALIVGVSDYTVINAPSLDLCFNDIFAFKKALIKGLNAKSEDIYICGESKTVTVNDFIRSFQSIVEKIDGSDTFFFYFSGHGAKKNNENYFVFSDDFIKIQEIVNSMENICCKNKIVIIDSCHSGSKNLSNISPIDINVTADQFVGHGCAVMASCNIDETSGFDFSQGLSLYTRIICDALTAKSLIRYGRKSLEDIKKYVDILANNANKKISNPQHNAFRSNIIGTIFFNIADYTPYKAKEIYKETDKYIIYDVSPVHANIKRLSIRVILRFPSTKEEIAEITNEIKNDALYYEVYQNEKAESRFKGMPTNIVWCYFGYDEDDMINTNFAYRTIWVDDMQDKGYWYKVNQNSFIIDNVKVDVNKNYEFMKKFISNNTADDETLIKDTRKCMYEMILVAEKFIKQFREYTNHTITEQDLIESVSTINTEIEKLYFTQSDFPIASKKLHDWQNAYTQLASTIHDLSLFYNKRYLNRRDSKNRKIVTELTIKSYNECLEKIKAMDTEFNFESKFVGSCNE